MASRNFSIGKIEAAHIAISVITVALAFTLFPVGSFSATRFTIIFLTLGAGFVLHELGHKFVAIRYGAQAEYRAWTTGLFVALFLAFVTDGGFIFAAPGAVYIFGKRVSEEQNGKIALAGPLVNLFLALIFLAIGVSYPEMQTLAAIGVSINAFLGAFNLIPIFPLDGSKVFAWNKVVWGATLIALVAILLTNPFPVEF
ncbi:site-2 protease family protein [Candidatus Micrarchaeota archaeon]|nr:site-2 protease family protein [Candidatus Micrarchaeota archaeon]